uniref:Uncharacterized protein n=1 Tax=Micrurus corallinus TaxID=54390 RepID=A0A2D4EM99_MICCO
MTSLVQCNTCFTAVFRNTLFKLGYCPLRKKITSLHGQITYLESLRCALQAEIRCPIQPSIELPCYQPPLPQRSYRKRAVWTTAGAVDHKRKAFAVSQITDTVPLLTLIGTLK